VPQGDHVDAARAVYTAAADRYVEFVGTEISAATESPVDQSVLTAFAELVGRDARPRVADVGCGPGRVAAFLQRRGLDVVGVDVSPGMLAAARIAHPDIEFVEGQLDDLPVDDASLAGIVCWYSIIYTPPDELGAVFVELERALRPGGHLLLAFQAGDRDAIHRSDAFGSGLPLVSHRHDVDDVTHQLERAAFAVHATTRREAEFDHEATPQAFVIARRP
jgi:SAM-dependent methyltransferase